MATIKHISSKNANYGDAEKYLTYKHDEFTNKPILDEKGRMIPRDDYCIETILCDNDDFAIACMRTNLKYGKNNLKGDVKSHHYIISFDPRDGTDNDLTIDRAQELGMNFCKEHFPGHQALVCTHPDGHNHSGNIHVHIVINSIRIEDVPFLPYMDRPCDTKAGMKHRCTSATLRYLRSEVMEMCHKENLYQIDLLSGSKERITDREYHAKRRGLKEISVENSSSSMESTASSTSKYETDKEILRRQIRAALKKAKSFEEFRKLLLEEGISVKESRGRFSYMTADRTKPITSRKLGDDFSKEAVLAQLEQNANNKSVENVADVIYANEVSAPKIPIQYVIKHDGLERIVDMDYARSKGIGYVNWAKIHNVKTISATLIDLHSEGIKDYGDLKNVLASAHSETSSARKEVKAIEKVIDDKKELLRRVQTIRRTKLIVDEYKSIKSKSKQQAFYAEHEADFRLRSAAFEYLKSHGITKFPSAKLLTEEIQNLISEKNARYNTYYAAKEKEKKLQNMKDNIDKFLNPVQREQPKRSHRIER